MRNEEFSIFNAQFSIKTPMTQFSNIEFDAGVNDWVMRDGGDSTQ